MRSVLAATAIAVVIAGLFSPFYVIGAPATNTAFAQQQDAASMQGLSACKVGQNATGMAPSAAGNQSSPSGAAGAANTTTAGESGGLMESLSSAKMHLQEACTALQGNDVAKALLHLVIVEKALGNIEGNMTSAAGNATGGQQNQTGGGLLDDLGNLFGR